jgi:Fur family ferric uptake transcriptional regulator
MRDTEKQIEGLLRQRGFKLTPQRRTILNTIVHSHEHLTPSAIHEKVCRESPSIGLVTIYRTLEILASLGLICEVHAGGSCRSYLLKRPTGHHHHLICTDCGAVIDFSNCDLSQLERRLARETSFTISSHLLEFLGQCRECREKSCSPVAGDYA